MLTLHQLISERDFDHYRVGLESRFKANRLRFSITYSDGPPNPSLYVRLEGLERLGDICAWESGDCDINVAAVNGEMKSKHVRLTSADGFHEYLAALFRFVVKREFPNDNLGN